MALTHFILPISIPPENIRKPEVLGGIEKDPGMKWVNRYDDGKQLYNVKILMKTIRRK